MVGGGITSSSTAPKPLPDFDLCMPLNNPIRKLQAVTGFRLARPALPSSRGDTAPRLRTARRFSPPSRQPPPPRRRLPLPFPSFLSSSAAGLAGPYCAVGWGLGARRRGAARLVRRDNGVCVAAPAPPTGPTGRGATLNLKGRHGSLLNRPCHGVTPPRLADSDQSARRRPVRYESCCPEFKRRSSGLTSLLASGFNQPSGQRF